MSAPHGHEKDRLLALSLAAIGVVFGDIGTSPLYAIKESFSHEHGIPRSPDNVLGILSLIFWSLTVVVTIKYVLFIMRADNRGEGGIMALLSLVQRPSQMNPRFRSLLVAMGIFGASLFYGDSFITPAISVLSAVEGLEIFTPALHPFIVPISLFVLLVLFVFQSMGTAKVGNFFGPVMVIWFLVLGLLGVLSILKHPEILAALYPGHALDFFARNHTAGFLVLGSVVLSVTGGEALYADMGHFGASPIRLSWFGLVMPALLLNYFGQGALILGDPAASENPFYLLAPGWAVLPMVALATLATVIASQAVISGAFSVTRQAIQLGFAPRMNILHTSEMEIGQVYIPMINWTLMLGVATLVVGFGSSSSLAAAYGIAVTGTMAIDTCLVFVVAYLLWKWKPLVVGVGVILFLIFDIAFFSANAVKFFQGGWFPISIALTVFTLMATWKRGGMMVFNRLKTAMIPLDPFLAGLAADPPVRVPGTAIYLTGSTFGVPLALLQNLNHNTVLHERIILLSVVIRDVPYVGEEDRIDFKSLPHGLNFHQLTLFYGFMDTPDVPEAIAGCCRFGLSVDLHDTSIFANRLSLVPSSEYKGMAMWRKRLYASMARNAVGAAAYFKIPSDRVVELGLPIEF
nr:Probable potassium transport system protein kup [uncultured bacterium]